MENLEMKREFWKGRKVFITGHSGFKGAWLTLWLKKLESIILGYSLGPPTKPSIFEAARIGEGIESIHGDVCDIVHLKSVMQSFQPEIVIHMAAQTLVRKSYTYPVDTYATNIMGTVNVLEALRSVDRVRAVIIVTSDKCYENKEWVWGYRENDPMGGYDPYSSSKGCAELITSCYGNSYFNSADYGKTHRVGLASVRAGNVIGGGDWAEDRLIPDCIRALVRNEPMVLRSPDAIRPWQHVLEPLAGYLMLLRRLFEAGSEFAGAWNFGPEYENAKTVEWIVEKIMGFYGRGIPWIKDKSNKPHESHFLKLDCSKAKSKLAWNPVLGIEVSLQDTVSWYKSYYSKEADLGNISVKQIEEYERMMKNEGNEL